MRRAFSLNGFFRFWCFDMEGNLKWKDAGSNVVVDAGLNHILDTEFTGAAQVTTWYVGLVDGSPSISTADTMTSHAGWNEVTAYSEGTRQEWIETRGAQAISNSASVAVFSINGSATIGGGFLCSDSTKGGTAGTLFCAEAFTGGDKAVTNGDTLNVEYTLSISDS